MRILVTGARGFIGRRLIPLLARHQVLALGRTPAEDHAGVHAISGDLTRPGAWQDEVARFEPDWCVHLAWDGLPDYSLNRCRVNLDANVGLIELLVKARVRRVVVAGSCWEYGSAAGAVKEDSAVLGWGVFAATKHCVRTMLDAVSRESGMEYRWARIFFAYGPGQREAALIPHLRAAFTSGTEPALRDPAAVNDFIHVDDVARGLVALTESDSPSGVFNIGTGTPASVGEIADRVAQHYGKPARYATVTRGAGFWADTTKTAAETGWHPRIRIEEGIQQTLIETDGAA